MSTQYPQHSRYPQHPQHAQPSRDARDPRDPRFPGQPESAGSRAGDVSRRPPVPGVALLGLVLLALAGVWLAAAPFLLGGHGPGDQPRGAAWSAATRVDVSTGAAITAVAVAALLGYLASSITHLARYRQVE